jgi:ComF family protein
MLSILDIFYPKFCLGCQRFGTYICTDCTGLIGQKELICPSCKKSAIGGQTHPLCQKKYGLDGLWSYGSYQGLLQKSIQTLKYQWVTSLVSPLIQLVLMQWTMSPPHFFTEISKRGGEDWCIVPVPLHPRRQKWRGFNQASLLSLELSTILGIPCEDILLRTRYTKPQVELKATERKQNLKGAFSLVTPRLRSGQANYSLPSTNILLVDDVWTTGSTLQECCKVLKHRGAKKVWAITLAR